MDNRLLKAEEVGHVLGVGRSKAYELIASGALPVVKIGRAVRVPERGLQMWIHEQTRQTDGVGGRSDLGASEV